MHISAGSSVMAARIDTATTTIAPMAIERIVVVSIRNSPARAIITVTPRERDGDAGRAHGGAARLLAAGARPRSPRGSGRARTASSPPPRRSRSSRRCWSRTPTCRSAWREEEDAGAGDHHAREPERQRQRGRGERAEHGQQDQQRRSGSPPRSAGSRSCLERSCMPAQSACWPTRCSSTLALRARRPCRARGAGRRRRRRPGPGCRSTVSGTTVIGRAAAPSRRRVRGRGGQRHVRHAAGRRAARARSRRARRRRRRRGGARPRPRAERAGRRRSPRGRGRPAAEPEPGNLEAAAREVLGLARGERERGEQQHEPGERDTSRPWRRVKPSSRSIAACMSCSSPLGWPASQCAGSIVTPDTRPRA